MSRKPVVKSWKRLEDVRRVVEEVGDESGDILWLLNVAEAAHGVAFATTHVNVSGPDYADRRAYYRTLRDVLSDSPSPDSVPEREV